MKKCKSCGALQKDERTTCIDCGGHLGAPLSDKELEAAESLLQEQLEKTTENTEEIQVTKFDFALIIIPIAMKYRSWGAKPFRGTRKK